MSASSSSPGGSSRGRSGRRLRFLAACVALLGVAGYLLTQYVTGGVGPPRCTVRVAEKGTPNEPGEYAVDPEQAANAATIEAVASARELSHRTVTIALATAMQESSLRNIDYGDRDSLGLFQQRPSQGWGDPKEILDPVYASGKFYDKLLEVPDHAELPLTVAAQKVQRSAHPRAYAKHEADADLLARALMGRSGAVLNCTTNPGDMADAGDPEAVRATLAREFGPAVLSGPSADRAARTDGADGADRAARTEGAGRAGNADPGTIELPVRSDARGRELAHWAVAHASQLHITRITNGDRVWSAERSTEGWREVESAERDGSTVVLRLASGT
ncbi:hypothetical protein [Streptomyces oceani]|uniref:ARB-07466-like C-terminal domain-containing protein n=1 Tax=Streptomyces oceani TaxID=1075402 RepID=A0A1E7JM92_9ACTN|nr:hypothetical protein [Streptomyces oceani]OEU88739.1 hypothetical protein AN216_25925 [Streptomyces oceani]